MHWRAVSVAYGQPLLTLSNKNKKTKVFLAFDLLIKLVFNRNMTLSLRNTLIKTLLFMAVILFLFYTISILYMSKTEIFSFKELIRVLSVMYGISNENLSNSLFWTITTTSVIFGFSLISSLLLFHYFKKKISPEIFFFILFILSLSFQTVRLFQFQLLVLNLSPFFGVIITRFYYFFRLFSIFCLFSSSLFPIGVKFQKIGTILISILLLAFTISALMPIDPTSMSIHFLYQISDRTSIMIMILSIRLLTLINFTRVAITTKSKNYLIILLASFMIIIGDELLLILPVPLIAFSLIMIGTVLYSRSIYTYYLWI